MWLRLGFLEVCKARGYRWKVVLFGRYMKFGGAKRHIEPPALVGAAGAGAPGGSFTRGGRWLTPSASDGENVLEPRNTKTIQPDR